MALVEIPVEDLKGYSWRLFPESVFFLSLTSQNPLIDWNFSEPMGLGGALIAYMRLYVLCTWHVCGLYVPVFVALLKKTKSVCGLYVDCMS